MPARHYQYVSPTIELWQALPGHETTPHHTPRRAHGQVAIEQLYWIPIARDHESHIRHAFHQLTESPCQRIYTLAMNERAYVKKGDGAPLYGTRSTRMETLEVTEIRHIHDRDVAANERPKVFPCFASNTEQADRPPPDGI